LGGLLGGLNRPWHHQRARSGLLVPLEGLARLIHDDDDIGAADVA
jgi:hypothetical protein